MKHIGLLFLLSSFSVVASAQVIDLRGIWKFHIGDKETWSSPQFNDAGWESIHVPSPWEDEGFNGYDGFAWYRRKFDGRKLDKNETYYIGLGFIDDCDEVYINGKLIGLSGSMPPEFKTSYNTERKYVLPDGSVNFGAENTIAIRVFDVVHEGGIIAGDPGIFRIRKDRFPLVDLQGIWAFATAPNSDRIKNDSEWKKIMVPSPWEKQGYPKYDGYAWYRRTFVLPPSAPAKGLVLLLGKVDDFDKVYLNGQLIGRTNDQRGYGRSESYGVNRVYDLPPDLLKRDGENLIEVLVQDIGNIGGIYEGIVGISTKADYEKYIGR